MTVWDVPTWAENTTYNHQDNVATHYSAENALVYLQRIDTIDSGKQVTDTPDLVLTLNDEAMYVDIRELIPADINRLIAGLQNVKKTLEHAYRDLTQEEEKK